MCINNLGHMAKMAAMPIHTCDIFFLHGRGISRLKSYYLLSYREVYFLVVMTNITWSNCTEADQAYSLFFVDAFEAEE